MFNLVLTLITLAFLAIGGYAALHANGGAILTTFEHISDKTTVMRLMNASQQIGAAQRFHLAVNGRPAETPELLVKTGFLENIPDVPGGMQGPWYLDETGKAILVGFEQGEDYDRFTARVCALAQEMGGSASIAIKGPFPSHRELDAQGVRFGCAQARMAKPDDPVKTWFIHGF